MLKFIEIVSVAIACPLIGFGAAYGNMLMVGIGTTLFFGSYLITAPRT